MVEKTLSTHNAACALAYLYMEDPEDLVVDMAQAVGVSSNQTNDMFDFSRNHSDEGLTSHKVAVSFVSYMINEKGESTDAVIEAINHVIKEQSGYALEDYIQKWPKSLTDYAVLKQMEENHVEMIRLPEDWSKIVPPDNYTPRP